MRIDDGFSTRIGFALDPTVDFWEKTVTPPGIQAGGAIDTTTMRSTKWRTMAPKQLRTLSDCTTTVAYDPACYDSIQDMLGLIQLITITFPDDSTVEFYGWIDEFTPGENQEGQQPTATVKIIPSNQDDTLVEQDLVYAAA